MGFRNAVHFWFAVIFKDKTVVLKQEIISSLNDELTHLTLL